MVTADKTDSKLLCVYNFCYRSELGSSKISSQKLKQIKLFYLNKCWLPEHRDRKKRKGKRWVERKKKRIVRPTMNRYPRNA